MLTIIYLITCCQAYFKMVKMPIKKAWHFKCKRMNYSKHWLEFDSPPSYQRHKAHIDLNGLTFRNYKVLIRCLKFRCPFKKVMKYCTYYWQCCRIQIVSNHSMKLSFYVNYKVWHFHHDNSFLILFFKVDQLEFRIDWNGWENLPNQGKESWEKMELNYS